MDSAGLSAARLARRRAGARYAIDEVDDFLDECVATLRSWEEGRPGRLSAESVVLAQFTDVPLSGEGYDADAVDELLDAVADRLRAYAGPSAAASSVPLPGDRPRWLVLGIRGIGVLAVVATAAMIAMRMLGKS